MFRIGTGIVMIALGMWLALAGVYEGGVGPVIPGVVVIVLGIFIVLNTHEDDIEEIKEKEDTNN